MSEPFHVEFPVWIVCHRERGPSNLPRTRLPDGSLLIAVFTDEDLAARYLEEAKAPADFGPRALDASELAALLAFVEKEDGVTHVAFDPDERRTSHWSGPIAELRADLERRIGGADPV